MLRHDRTRFFAFGLLTLANTIGLLGHGLNLATHGTGGAGRSLPVLMVLAALCLLISLVAAIKRGRDLGWPGGLTAAVYVLAIGTGIAAVVLIGYFSIGKGAPEANRFGPPPPAAGADTWVWALLNLAWPWMILAAAARLL